MTTQTLAKTSINTNVLAVVFAALLGLSIIAIAGHVQADGLHHNAHDVRHAAGFPCH